MISKGFSSTAKWKGIIFKNQSQFLICLREKTRKEAFHIRYVKIGRLHLKELFKLIVLGCTDC